MNDKNAIYSITIEKNKVHKAEFYHFDVFNLHLPLK